MKELMNEGMKDMKRVMMIMVLGALMACLVPMNAQNAQQNQWKTATVQGSGSAYSSNVTAVGATSAASVATTTESYSLAKAPGGPRKGFDVGGDAGQGPSPVGDAVLPLMALLGVYCTILVIRRNKHVKE